MGVRGRQEVQYCLCDAKKVVARVSKNEKSGMGAKNDATSVRGRPV